TWSYPSLQDRMEAGEHVEHLISQLAMLYVALYTITLCGGGIKSNISGFRSDPREKLMDYFFNRGWGFRISARTMIIAVIVLLCERTLYWFKKPQGSPPLLYGEW
nr:hypothetical protein [Tanacetum cinerariifolium]